MQERDIKDEQFPAEIAEYALDLVAGGQGILIDPNGGTRG